MWTMSDPPPSDDRTGPLLPLHCVVDGAEGRNVRFARRVGRPKKVNPRPDQQTLDYATEIDRQRRTFIEQETASYEAEPDGIERVWNLLRLLAQEAASLRFQRRLLEVDDRSGVEKITSRIVETYARIGALVFELRKLGGAETLDVRNPKMQLLVSAFNDQLEAAARETLGEKAETFLSRYRKMAEGWEERV
jgi:hypothetical protein